METPGPHVQPTNPAALDESVDWHSTPTRPQKRSFSIAGHRTSISLETAFWQALREIAAQQGRSLASLIAQIDRERGNAGLSGAVRVYVLDHYRAYTVQPGDNGKFD